MSETTELIAQQILNGNINKRTWGDILYNVKSWGAKGDGITDDTTAIQSALNAAKDAGGGIVYCPRGLYKLTSQITIPKGVILRGVDGNCTPQYQNGAWNTSSYGTVLCIKWGAGASLIANAAVLLSSYSKIEDLSFWYPDQLGDTATPVEYPPSLAHINGDPEQSVNAVVETYVMNVTFVNPWIAMDFTRAHTLLNVYNVKFAAWKKGLRIDDSTDIDRIVDVHANPNTMYSGAWPDNNVYVYQLANAAVGFEIGKADQIYFTRCFVYGYHVSFWMLQIGANPPSGLFMEQCGFEYGNYGMIINGPVRRIKLNNVALSTNSNATGKRALQIALPVDTIIDEVHMTQITVFLSALEGMYLENINQMFVDNCAIYVACAVNQAFEVAALRINNCSGFSIRGMRVEVAAGNPLAIESTVSNCNGFSISDIFLSGQSRSGAADMYISTSTNGVINQGFLTTPKGTGFQKDGSSPTVTIGTVITY